MAGRDELSEGHAGGKRGKAFGVRDGVIEGWGREHHVRHDRHEGCSASTAGVPNAKEIIGAHDVINSVSLVVALI